eukprot:Opistho-1_new@105046
MASVVMRGLAIRAFRPVVCARFSSDIATRGASPLAVPREQKDVRDARFIDRVKEVNPHPAMDLINAIPPKKVHTRVVACDGGGGALGHPKIYINLDKPGPQACGYCGLRFEKDDHHH